MFRLIITLVLCSTLSACSETPSKKSGPSTSACGNGVLDNGELCDPDISAGEAGACPTSCGSDACSSETLVGSASSCTAACATQESMCANGDGCCGLGCDAMTDDDCTNVCGNGMIESPETCDGDCGTCDDGNACTAAVVSGNADSCSQTCAFEPITSCVGDDGCCPSGCDSATDSDCSDSCGDDVIDPNETCDGDCPTTCEDNNDCTDDVLLGSAQTCSSSCTNTNKTVCQNDDGCCPTGCKFDNDNDCTCTPTTTCSSLGWLCGTVEDNGCAKTENCGTCDTAGGEVCNPSNRCEQGFDIGLPCTNNNSCAGDACFEALATGIPGGYCTKGCRSNSDCGANHCGNINTDGDGVCFKSCQADADCRAGHECYDFTGDGINECMPVGSGNSPIGGTCNVITDCAGGQGASCTTEANDAKDGYCLDTCQVDADCGVGGNCVGEICMQGCANNSQCRSNGYACFDVDGDGQNECWRSGTGNSPVGGPCQGIWDCDGDEFATCVSESNGFPGGFCSISCALGNGTCPNNTACSTDVGEFCMPLCPNGNECRNGYTCQSIDVGDACFP